MTPALQAEMRPNVDRIILGTSVTKDGLPLGARTKKGMFLARRSTEPQLHKPRRHSPNYLKLRAPTDEPKTQKPPDIKFRELDTPTSDIKGAGELHFLQGEVTFNDASPDVFLTGDVIFGDIEGLNPEEPVTFGAHEQTVFAEADSVNERPFTTYSGVAPIPYATVYQAVTTDLRIDSPAVNLMKRAESNFQQATVNIVNNTARLMQTYNDAWAAHLAICNGSDGGHGVTPISSQTWISAYDASSARVNELMMDARVQAALATGDVAQAESIIQREALRVYQEKTGIDTAMLRNMSDKLYRVIDPAQALAMMQGALSHVGCVCHNSQLMAMNTSLFTPELFDLKKPTLDLRAPELDLDPKNQHEHKHTEHVCGNCGWKGETCTGDNCPRCSNKNWDN